MIQTNKVETYEQRMAREKAKRKREQELEEAMILAYMAGNAGNGYAMLAAAEMSA